MATFKINIFIIICCNKHDFVSSTEHKTEDVLQNDSLSSYSLSLYDKKKKKPPPKKHAMQVIRDLRLLVTNISFCVPRKKKVRLVLSSMRACK